MDNSEIRTRVNRIQRLSNLAYVNLAHEMSASEHQYYYSLLHEMKALAEESERLLARGMREYGRSWSEIAALTGLSKSAAWEKWRWEDEEIA